MSEEIIARTKYVRISPRKARLAARLIARMPAETALLQLKTLPMKGARLLKKTLDSAVANAQENFSLKVSSLRIQEVRVDEGPTMKRAKSKNRGGRVPIMKRTSHFTIVLRAE
ncbi:MAG: 50S ribosomal protein L22 [Chlamydiota bacterium]